MNASKFLWGLSLLLVGLLLIADNLGYVSVTIWFDILRLWPLIIIFIGLKLVIKNEYVVLVIGLAIIAVSLAFVISNNDNRWQYRVPYMPVVSGNTFSEATQNFNENWDKNSIKKVNLSINSGASRLVIKDLPEGDSRLYSIEAKNLLRLEVDKSETGNTKNIDISEQARRMMMGTRFSGDRELTVLVSRGVTLQVEVNSGASNMDLDFSDLNLSGLELKSGATNGHITLGNKVDVSKISVDAGASDFGFSVPSDAGFMVTNDSGLSTLDISSDFKTTKLENVTKTDNYDMATKKIDFVIKSGVTKIVITKK